MSETMKVRCVDKTMFRVDPVTLEPMSCEVYDAYCYADPEPGVVYIEHANWCVLRNERRREERGR